MTRSLLLAAALCAALPAAAQPVSPLYQSVRDAGASSADAAGLTDAMSAAASQQDKVNGSAPVASAYFGFSVSLSGETALVGAYNADCVPSGSQCGTAYVFVRSGTSWTQQARLIATDATAFDLFGFSVSLSGETALVGAYNSASVTGSAYVFVRSGTTWTQQAKLTASDAAPNAAFGKAVSLSGETALVGADGDPGSGSAYVFVRSGTAWTQQAKLTGSGAAANCAFGRAVSLAGETALIGALLDDGGSSSSGTAYVFVRSGAAWTQQAKITASDAASADLFGNSVSLSGETALIGAQSDDDVALNSGSAYVFVRSGTAWTQRAKLTAADPAAADNFGYSVSLSGETALVGAYRDDDSFNNSGSAYVFVRSGTAWTQQDKLHAADPAAGDTFGTSVSLSGETALIGAPFDDDSFSNSGSAYLFTGLPATVTQASLFNPSSAQGDGDGYRLLGAPVPTVTVTDLARLNLVQGIVAGTDAAAFPAQYPLAGANLYTGYTGNGLYTAPDADDVLAPGRGFFWRFYDRDIAVTTGFGGGTSSSRELTGFALSATGVALAADVLVPFADNVGAGTDNFQMLANPFARPLAVSGISVSGGILQGTDVVQAYNPNGRTYVPRMAGDRLAVWQGVFAELVPTVAGGAVTVTYAYASTDAGAPPTFYGKGTADAPPSIRFALSGTLASGASVADDATAIRFVAGADAGWDAFDASKLTPPVAERALLAPTILRDGQPTRLAVDSRTRGAAATIPLAFSATDGGLFTLSWTASLPQGWTATLTDAATGQTLDLASATETAFTTAAAQDWAERFTLAVRPAGTTATDSGTEPRVSLSAPVPNPATSRTALMLSLDAPQHVRASVVDALGRDVLIVLDGEASGAVRLDVDTSRLAPGVYVVRVAGTSFAETRRLTVVR